MSLGCLSYLQPRIDPNHDRPHSFDYSNAQEGVCIFYGRDRGEKDQQAFPVRMEEVDRDDWIEYCYVFTRDGTWKYFKPNDAGVKLRDLETDLNGIFKGYGIDRPPNDYGWFSIEEIAKLKLAAEQKRQSGAGAAM